MILITAVLIECLLLALGMVRVETAHDCITLAIVHCLCFILYTVAVYSQHVQKYSVWVIIGSAVIFKLTLLFQPILASDDIYRYMWDGKVSTLGINPYIHAPNDSTLAQFHSADIPGKVNVPYLKSVYPPLAQVVFASSSWLFGESITGLKFFLFIFDVATLWVVYLILLIKKLPLQSIILWAWNPLTHFVTELDGHIEIVGVFFLALLLLVVMRSKWKLAGVILGLSALVKPQPLGVVAPLTMFLTRKKNYSTAIVLCISALAVFGVGYAIYWEPTWAFAQAFVTMSKRWYYNNPPFDILHIFLSNETAHTVLSVMLAVYIVITSIQKLTAIEHIRIYFLGILLLSPMIQPWYLLWVLLFLPFMWSPSMFVFSATIILCYKTVYVWQLQHVWHQEWWELCVEYVPVYTLLLVQLYSPDWLRKFIPPILQTHTE